MGTSPKGITVVSCGRRDVGRFYDSLTDAGESHAEWEHCDLTKYLIKDPATSVGHHEDGNYPQTQRCVVRQERFPEILIYFLNLACGCATDRPGQAFTKFLLSCESGWHRASTCAMFLCCLLNYIVRDGRRSFNANKFGLHDCYGKHGFPQRIEHAIEWSREPWSVKDGGVVPRHTLFAYDACSIDPVASRNWSYVFDEVDAAHSAEVGPDGVPFPPPLSVPTPDEVTAPSAPSNSNVAPSLYQQVRPPHPPTSPPPTHLSSIARASSSSAPAYPSFPPPVDGPTDELPEWFTFDRDVSVWWRTLRNEGVDEDACKSLILLAQHSDDGYRAANALLAKITKKRADGEILTNPSGFIHKCSLNARHSIEKDQWSYSKKARW